MVATKSSLLLPLRNELYLQQTKPVNRLIQLFACTKIIKYFNMQKQNQAAQFVFGRLGIAFDPKQIYQPEVIYSQVVLGSLFVRSYRGLFKEKTINCCTFIKRAQSQTKYLFLKFIQSKKSPSLKNDFQDIQSAVSKVRKIKLLNETEMFDFRVLLCFLHEKASIQINNTEFYRCKGNLALLQEMEQKNEAEEEEVKEIQDIVERECQEMIGSYDLQMIKTVVWAYLDTFGAKYKDKVYYEMVKRQTSLSIERIINTVNWIIYTQTLDKPYNQLESNTWTCFESQAKDKCKIDRKEIVLSGCARILYIPLFFICEKVESYSKERDDEIYEVIQQLKSHYQEAQIKAYLITDEIDHEGLIYKTESHSLRRFSH